MQPLAGGGKRLHLAGGGTYDLPAGRQLRAFRARVR